jgi:hypothetical protein
MGLFDRFTHRKGAPDNAAPAKPAEPAPPPAEFAVPVPAPSEPASAVMQRLRTARERLEAKDLPGALTIYEEVLASGGDRPDVLMTISGDLGSFGQVRPIIELIAPRYVAERHGPAAGINLLQAYLAVRDPDSAQHVLDVLFGLKRPDLDERLYGFSNAISDMMLSASMPGAPEPPPVAVEGGLPVAHRGALVSVSKPVWFYGLETLAPKILPPKEAGIRRVAFAQLALPGGYPDFGAAMTRPEDELGRLSRGIPAWLAESFYFSPRYSSNFAIALWEEPGRGHRFPMVFGDEWGVETLRQLVDSTEGGLDYIVTGTLRQRAGDYEAGFRIWEVKKFRERKQLLARWTPGSADEELGRLRQALGQFMEWQPYPPGSGIAFVPLASARAWIEGLGASLILFLAEKGIWVKELVPPMESAASQLARLAPSSEIGSLAWITFSRRARALGLAPLAGPERLFSSELVKEAEALAF